MSTILSTWIEDSADHARQHHHEEGQNLKVGSQQRTSFSMQQVLSSQRALHYNLYTCMHARTYTHTHTDTQEGNPFQLAMKDRKIDTI